MRYLQAVTAWALIVLGSAVILAACTAIPGTSGDPSSSEAAAATASREATNAPVEADVTGEDAVMARLVELKEKSECITTGESLMAYPTKEDLTKVDEDVAAGRLVNGRDAKGRIVGDSADVVRLSGGTEVLIDSQSEVWFLIEKSERGPTGMGFLGVPTPAGNTVWLRQFTATPDACPEQ